MFNWLITFGCAIRSHDFRCYHVMADTDIEAIHKATAKFTASTGRSCWYGEHCSMIVQAIPNVTDYERFSQNL